MLLFHINPATFEPSVCKARQGNCPFGLHVREDLVAGHFKVYEAAMADYTLVKFSQFHGKLFDYMQRV